MQVYNVGLQPLFYRDYKIFWGDANIFKTGI